MIAIKEQYLSFNIKTGFKYLEKEALRADNFR